MVEVAFLVMCQEVRLFRLGSAESAILCYNLWRLGGRLRVSAVERPSGLSYMSSGLLLPQTRSVW